MISYIGTTGVFPHTINIPQNAVDNVDANTVDPSFMTLADQCHYTVSKVLQRPHIVLVASTNKLIAVISHSPVAVASPGVTPLWWLSQGFPGALIGEGNLEVGSSFSANTAYYIYLYVVVSGASTTSNYEISTTPPDSSLTFKSPLDPTRRYLGSFVTNPSQNIVEFSMVDYVYTFGQRLLGTLTVNSGTPTQTVDFTVPTPINSTYVKNIDVKCDVTTNEFNTSFLTLKPKGKTITTNYKFSAAGVGANYFSYTDRIFVFTDSKFTATLTNGGTGTITADVNMVGYSE